MNIALWIVQALLALAFFGAGASKLAMAPDELVAQGMNYVNYIPHWLLPIIGISEIAGALGLVLPSALKIQPKLTPIAASGLVLVMALASITHLSIGEYMIVPNLVLGGLAAFVAWGRFKVAPIEAGDGAAPVGQTA